MPHRFEKISVLIVDRQLPLIELIKDILKTLGIRHVMAHTDGRGALEQFNKQKPDLVIIDWDLGSMSGLQFTKALRSDPANSRVPVILMSTLSPEERVIAARDAGITEFLKKPFTTESLYKRIESIVERPRPFVQSDNFTGPDRRRKQDTAYTGDERRQRPDENKNKT